MKQSVRVAYFSKLFVCFFVFENLIELFNCGIWSQNWAITGREWIATPWKQIVPGFMFVEFMDLLYVYYMQYESLNINTCIRPAMNSIWTLGVNHAGRKDRNLASYLVFNPSHLLPLNLWLLAVYSLIKFVISKNFLNITVQFKNHWTNSCLYSFDAFSIMNLT